MCVEVPDAWCYNGTLKRLLNSKAGWTAWKPLVAVECAARSHLRGHRPFCAAYVSRRIVRLQKMGKGA